MVDSQGRATNRARRDGSRVPLPALSYGFLRFGELQQVVNRTDQTPLALNIGEPSQQELPEPALTLRKITDAGALGI